jgi:hypothetical protein
MWDDKGLGDRDIESWRLMEDPNPPVWGFQSEDQKCSRYQGSNNMGRIACCRHISVRLCLFLRRRSDNLDLTALNPAG